MTFAPWQRPSVSATAGNHEDRIRAIERHLGVGEGDQDIHYGDNTPTDIDAAYVYIGTELAGPTFGYGFQVQSDVGGIKLGAVDHIVVDSSSDVSLQAGDDMLIDAVDEMTLTANDKIEIASDATIQILGSGAAATGVGLGWSNVISNGFMRIGSELDAASLSANDQLLIASFTKDTVVLLPDLVGTASDYSFRVGRGDGLGGIFEYLRVDNDGTVHIPTGSAILADLSLTAVPL